MYELERVAAVKVKPNMAILSLICNVERTSEILMRTFKVFIEEGINVQMLSQGASKVCAPGKDGVPGSGVCVGCCIAASFWVDSTCPCGCWFHLESLLHNCFPS